MKMIGEECAASTERVRERAAKTYKILSENQVEGKQFSRKSLKIASSCFWKQSGKYKDDFYSLQ